MGAESDDRRDGELPGTSPEDQDDRDRTQRPMEVDRTKYYEPGFVALVPGKDGLPMIVGPDPLGPEPGLSDDNFVCSRGPDRSACRHYGALLVPANGVSRGHEPLREIRRFCKRLSTASELFELDGDVYACTLRTPPDERSQAKIDAFEAEQKRLGREAAEKSGSLDF